MAMAALPELNEYNQLYGSFMQYVNQYNPSQQDQILQVFDKTLQNILASLKAYGAQPEQWPAMTRETEQKLKALEVFLGDKLYQLGSKRTVFSRFDHSSTGKIPYAEFKAAIGTLGVLLSDGELELLAVKYAPNGEFGYDVFISTLSSQHDKGANQSSNAQAQRTAVSGRPQPDRAQVEALVNSVTVPVATRLQNGLKILHQRLQANTKKVILLYKQLQNEEGLIPVDSVATKLPSLGFPTHLDLTIGDLTQLVNDFSKEKAGFLTYKEFLAFFLGQDEPADPSLVGPYSPNRAEPPMTMNSAQPALMDVLVKISALNLRKVFKEIDSDNNGMISTQELATGLVEHGLPAQLAQYQPFLDYLDGFTTRAKGRFGYAEFIKFVNTRTTGSTTISGQPMQVTSPTEINAQATPSQILDTMSVALRGSGVSVESLLRDQSASLDRTADEGFVSLEEFRVGLRALGFVVSAEQSQAVFAIFDRNQENRMSASEFSRIVANPNRNPSLNSALPKTPGGETSVPLGSFATDRPPVEYVKNSKFTQNPGGTTTLSFEPVGENEIVQQLRDTISNVSTLDLSSEAKEGDVEQYKRQLAFNPGPASNIDFAGDHGHAGPASVVASHTFESTLQFNDLEIERTTFTPGEIQRRIAMARQSNAVTFDGRVPDPAVIAHTNAPPPGGNSTISMKQTDVLQHVPLRAGVDTPNKKSNVDLSMAYAAPTNNATPQKGTPGPVSTVDLSFNPTSQETNAISHAQKSGGAIPQNSSINFETGGPEEANLPHGKYVNPQKNVSTLAIAPNNGASALLAKFDEPPAALDPALLSKMAAVIYKRGRLRHSFQEFNKGVTPVLPKGDLKTALIGVCGIEVSDADMDSIYGRFDQDNDGSLTYSEFVRMLATKS